MNRPQQNRYGYRPRPDDVRLNLRDRYAPRPERHTNPIGQRLTAAAFAIALIGFLACYGLWAVSAADTAARILARAIPTITEVDRLLALHESELQQQAKSANGAPLALPGFPISVALTPREVLSLSPERQQLVLEQRAALLLYTRGPAAFAAGGPQRTLTGPLFSPTWTLKNMLKLLNARTHARLATLSLLLGGTVLLLGLAFCLQVGGYGRLVGLAATGMLGSLMAALATLFVWLVVQFYSAGASSPLALAAWSMTLDVTWSMVLIDAAAFVTCTCLLVAGIGFAALDREPHPGRVPPPVPVRMQPARRRPLDPSKFD